MRAIFFGPKLHLNPQDSSLRGCLGSDRLVFLDVIETLLFLPSCRFRIHLWHQFQHRRRGSEHRHKHHASVHRAVAKAQSPEDEGSQDQQSAGEAGKQGSGSERGQWYFQRFVSNLPTAGEIVLLDRSWYNRAGVERVMGFCSDSEYHEFMRQVPEFERHLVHGGIHLIKFWFSVSRKEQRRRFRERQSHPLKHWKLSPIDLASLDKWDDYTRAKESMFFDTDTADAPWTVVKSDCKKRARLNAMRYVLHKLQYTSKDLDHIGKLDRLIVGRAHVVYERGERAASIL